MKNKKINVAQIGVGYWGPNILRNLEASNRCEISKVVDLSEERRRFVKRLYPNICVSSDVGEIFNDDNIDAVVISTPAKTHFDLVMQALKHNKHILVEKPMSRTVEEIDKIADLAKEKNKIAMVGHTFLYNSAVRYLKKLIDSGELGDIRYIYSQRLNLGRIRSDIDALWNLAPHDVSIIQYLLNNTPCISCTRSGMDYVQDGIEDVVFLKINYPDKVIAHIHVSWLDPNKTRKMTVVGSKKMVVYDDMAENKIAIYDKGIDRMAVLGENMDFDNCDFYTFNHRSGDVLFPKVDFKEPLKVEIDHFLDCINGESECLTDVKHAKNVIEILATK